MDQKVQALSKDPVALAKDPADKIDQLKDVLRTVAGIHSSSCFCSQHVHHELWI